MKKRVLYTVFVSFAIFLAACGQKLSGVYTSDFMELDFQSGSKVLVGTMGVKTELKYEVDGKKLKIMEADGKPPLVLTINDDGSIQGWGGQVFRKQGK
ncbi:MAG: hypothetical protein LBI48_05805 [Burkholderiaceae bacterium]|jgi:hypothetical protein|nr:hypothetical protein [Burkholderiaceae bacterium]